MNEAFDKSNGNIIFSIVVLSNEAYSKSIDDKSIFDKILLLKITYGSTSFKSSSVKLFLYEKLDISTVFEIFRDLLMSGTSSKISSTPDKHIKLLPVNASK